MNRASRSTERFRSIFVAVALLVALTAFCACNPQQPAGDNGIPSAYTVNTEFPEEFSGFLHGKKLYVTSLGQSGDILKIQQYLNGENIDAVCGNFLLVDEIEENSVLFLVVGCSIKGMAENGVTPDSEIYRAEQYVKTSEQRNVSVIAWHIGGPSRRGYTSDTLIEYVFGRADLDLFTASGNLINNTHDLSDWAVESGTAYCQLADLSVIPDILKHLAGGVDND